MNLRNSGLVRQTNIRLMEKLRRTNAAAILPGLMRSQFQPHAELDRAQVELLRKHLVRCRDTVPYYRNLFSAKGFVPEQLSSQTDLEALPVMSKKVIKDAGAALFSSTFSANGARPKSTSGSTGIPLNYYLDLPSHSHLWAHIWRGWSEAGYTPGDIYATLSGGSLLPEKVDLKQKIYLFLSGAVHLPSYHLTDTIMSGYAKTLARSRIRFMYGYPSSLELFARFATTHAVPGLSFAAVFTTSELLTSEARATIELGLKAPVFDTYGCNAGGIYAFECREHAGWHQNMESCVTEVVDEAGKQVPDGEIGRIVTTHLTNQSHPFLRYNTGDMGALDRSPCPCGRGLLRIVRIQGRERDIVVTPTGRSIHGAFFNHFAPFYESPWLDRYQILQPDPARIVVRMKTNRPPSTGEKEHIIALLKSGLDNMEIELCEVDEFELTATGKFRVVISKLDPSGSTEA